MSFRFDGWTRGSKAVLYSLFPTPFPCTRITLKNNAAGNLFLLTKTKTRTRTEWNLGSRLTKLIHCCTYSLSKVPWNPPIHELFLHIIIPIHPYLICVGFFFIGSSCRECRHTVNSGGPSGWLFCLGPNSRQDLLWEAWGLISGQPFDPYANSSFGHRCGSMSVPLGPVPLSPSHLLLGVGALWWVPLCNDRSCHPWHSGPSDDGKSRWDFIWYRGDSYDSGTSYGR